jgi:hypothetical protein
LRGQVFDSEILEVMSAAYADDGTTLDLVDRTDPIAELFARQIIELANAVSVPRWHSISARSRNLKPIRNKAASVDGLFLLAPVLGSDHSLFLVFPLKGLGRNGSTDV